MISKHALRYLAPNLVTTISLTFGLLSIAATMDGNYASAGWWIVYATLTDRLDGFVARLVRGTSELGVQLDSFADFLNFGLAPAFLVYASLVRAPELPFADGIERTLLMAACASWVIAATFRLARYNITDEVETPMPTKIFFGVPTTLAGGLLVLWYLTLYKYSPAGSAFPALAEPFGGVRLIGGFETPMWVWRYIPVAMFIGAYLMVSSLRMPHLGRLRSRTASIILYVFVGVGVFCGFARLFPEYMILPATAWMIVYSIWGQISPVARGITPPPVFPRD